MKKLEVFRFTVYVNLKAMTEEEALQAMDTAAELELDGVYVKNFGDYIVLKPGHSNWSVEEIYSEFARFLK